MSKSCSLYTKKIEIRDTSLFFCIFFGVSLDSKLFKIMSTESFEGSGHMRCVQACAKILNIAQILEYDSVIQFYPVCGKKSVDTGELIAKKLYNYNLPTLNIYKTNSCFN
jgi:hypothetical protein